MTDGMELAEVNEAEFDQVSGGGDGRWTIDPDGADGRGTIDPNG